jgi:predicted TIM-barrel fold metal-dependent hydrolase
LPDVEASLTELAYAYDTLGMDGVGLLSNYHGLYLGDPKLDAIFAELNRRKAVVLVHPTEPVNFKTFNIGLSAPVLEFTFDSTRMAQNLVQTGTKAKYPDITIIVAHGGGTLPYSQQRLVKYGMNGKNDIFNTFSYDLTATTEPEQIRALMALADPRKCFMGFDFPFMKPDWWNPLQKTLEEYDFEPGILRSIQNENALRFFPNVKQRLRQAGRLD